MKLTKTELKKIELFSRKIASQAGQLALKYWQKNITHETKTTSADIVTIADKKIDKLICRAIKKNFPNHDIISEESRATLNNSDFWWLIDPIDGTIAFSHGLPGFSISIGLFYKKKLIFGLVFDPVMNEMFWATTGHGAYLNGRKIHCSKIKDMSKTVFATGLPYQRNGKIFEKEISSIKKIIRLNQYIYILPSSALNICYVACGRLDSYGEMTLWLHDFAGGMAILEEAGGICSQADGSALNIERVEKGQSFLCANPFLYKKLLKIMK